MPTDDATHWHPYLHALGPIWQCALGLPGNPASAVKVRCLLDTGAQHTLVEPSRCRQLGVIPTAQGETLGLHSRAPCDLSRLDLAVPKTTGGVLVFPNILIYETSSGAERDFEVIIGNNVLRFFEFRLDGPGARFYLHGEPLA